MFYEVYSDVFLFRMTLSGSLERLFTGFIREMKESQTVMNIYSNISLIDLVRYLVMTYTKTIILLFIAICQLVLISLKYAQNRKNSFNDVSRRRFSIMVMFQIVSILLWLIGYVGTGSFLSGGRVIGLLQLFISANLLSLLIVNDRKDFLGFQTRVQKFSIKKTSFAFLLILVVIFNIVSNWGIYFLNPTLTYHGETRKPTSNTVVSPLILESLLFVRRYGSSNILFTCLKPHITFGYCDLLLNVSKLPRHGCLSSGYLPDEAIEKLRLLRNKYDGRLIIPIAAFSNLTSNKYGWKSFYNRSLRYLTARTNIIYNLEYYLLFFS